MVYHYFTKAEVILQDLITKYKNPLHSINSDNLSAGEISEFHSFTRKR